jgi:hypothetical protein
MRSIPEKALRHCDVLKDVGSGAELLVEGWKLEL